MLGAALLPDTAVTATMRPKDEWHDGQLHCCVVAWLCCCVCMFVCNVRAPSPHAARGCFDQQPAVSAPQIRQGAQRAHHLQVGWYECVCVCACIVASVLMFMLLGVANLHKSQSTAQLAVTTPSTS